MNIALRSWLNTSWHIDLRHYLPPPLPFLLWLKTQTFPGTFLASQLHVGLVVERVPGAAGGGGAFNKGNAITPRHRHPSVCTLSQLDTKKYCQTSLFKNWHTRSFLDSKQRTAFNKGNAITSRHRHQSICTLSQLETASLKNTSTARHVSSKTSLSFLDSTYSTNLRSVFHILWNGWISDGVLIILSVALPQVHVKIYFSMLIIAVLYSFEWKVKCLSK